MPDTIAERVLAAARQLSARELAVAKFLQSNREEALIASAAALAKQTGTSDATVIRTARTLGYSGLADLRRKLAAELKVDLSPAARLRRTLGEVRRDGATALAVMIDVHVRALEALRQDIGASDFAKTTALLAKSRRVAVFGIGPSSAIADYFATQLRRFGVESISLTQTGLLLADGLNTLRKGDLVIAMAYSRVYREIDALLAHASRVGARKILLTDTLGAALRHRVDLVLQVARGKADWFSTHTATLGLIEALLVGLAARRPTGIVSSLKKLNELRAQVTGGAMDLPVSKRRRGKRR
jgi:DNA-binding MurR/RpiR family transcriptional regulator